jgi:cytochrome bd-type quinol oxidase subunit 2
MNTHTQQVNATPTTAPAWPVLAAIGAGVSAILIAMGSFWDLTNNEEGQPAGWSEFLTVCGIIVVATVVVFGLVVRPATQANAATRALILSVVGFLSLAAFWAGLPAVLAAASIACALIDRQSGRVSRRSYAAVSISVVTVGLALLAAIAG